MSVMTDIKLGLWPGPLHDRLDRLNRAAGWYGWAGYAAPSVLDTMEFEYFALRNQAGLLDISPMHKYGISGRDASRVLNRMMTRDVTKIRPGRVGYTLWCDEEGMVIDDGTLFRLDEADWRLCCQEPMLDWLLEAGWHFDVEIVDESHTVAALALQGPTSFSVLRAAGLDVASLRPFDHAEVDGIRISRTGFTGDLGYELWVPWDNAGALWDQVWEGGRDWGLRAVGYDAVNIARIEAGFLTAGVDFQPVQTTERLHRGRTPFELGLGRLVDWTKGHFNGRRALVRCHDRPRSRLMRLEVSGFEAAPGALVYHRQKREVGHVSSSVWSPTTKRAIALAHVATPHADRYPTNLWAEIYLLKEGVWETRMERLTPIKGAFFAPARARATPPAAT